MPRLVGLAPSIQKYIEIKKLLQKVNGKRFSNAGNEVAFGTLVMQVLLKEFLGIDECVGVLQLHFVMSVWMSIWDFSVPKNTNY